MFLYQNDNVDSKGCIVSNVEHISESHAKEVRKMIRDVQRWKTSREDRECCYCRGSPRYKTLIHQPGRKIPLSSRPALRSSSYCFWISRALLLVVLLGGVEEKMALCS